MRALREVFNDGDQNKLGAANQILRMGDAVAQIPRTIRSAVNETTDSIVLPQNAKAVAVLACVAIAGTATGQFTPVIAGATPATTQVGVNLLGDIVFAAADNITEAEVTYLSREGQVIEEVITVASNSGTLGAGRKTGQLLEVEALVGTSTGVKTLIARGASPSAGESAVDLDGDTVSFNASDAVTSARVKYVATPGEGSAPAAVGVGLDSEDRFL